MVEQVLLADDGIASIKAQMAAGTMDQHEGEEIIDTFEQTIRSFVRGTANDAIVIASAGQVSDVPKLQKTIAILLGIARQDALMGREELARYGTDQMTEILLTFTTAFVRNCRKQKYKPEFAMGLQRQLELLGTGVDAGVDVGSCVIPDLAVIDEFELVYEIRTEAAGFAF